MTVDFLSEFMKAKRNGTAFFQVLKEKNCQPRILYPVQISFRNEGETKTFSDEEKLREFVASIPTLKEWLKEIL